MNYRVRQLLYGLALLPATAFAQTVPLTQNAYVVPGSGTTFGGGETINVVGPNNTAGLMQFDLSTLPSGTTSANVAKATLTLFADTVIAAGTFNVSVANGAWTETTVGGTNAPTVGAPVASGVETPAVSSFVYVDVTAAIKDWISGSVPNDGFILTPLSADVDVWFDSKENTYTSQPPTLTIFLTSVVTGVTGATGPAGAIMSSAGANAGDIPTLTQNITGSAGSLPSQSGQTGVVVANSGVYSAVAAQLLNSPSNYNLFLGYNTGNPTSKGYENTGFGYNVLPSVNGNFNVAIGNGAMNAATTATFNIGIGANALGHLQSTNENVCVGHECGEYLTTGTENVGVGDDIFDATTFNGSYNTGMGGGALQGLTSGAYNAVSGYSALFEDTTGSNNSCIGSECLLAVTTGSYNSSLGFGSGSGNKTGSYNTHLGYLTKSTANNVQYATAIGAFADVECSSCMVFGAPNGSAGAVNVGIGLTTPTHALDVVGYQTISEGLTLGSNTRSSHALNVVSGGPDEAIDFADTNGIVQWQTPNASLSWDGSELHLKSYRGATINAYNGTTYAPVLSAANGAVTVTGSIAATTSLSPGGSVTWTFGAGAPSGSCATGSLYSNTSGTAGSTLYDCVSGAWRAFAAPN